VEWLKRTWKRILDWLDVGQKVSDSEAGHNRRWLIVCGGGAVLVVLTLWLISLLPIGGDLGQRTNALGALFSGLAFAGLIITLVQQQHELSLQRQELHDTREELRRTAQAQEQQLETQQRDSSRQSREQLLTARLAVESALLQSRAAIANLTPSHTGARSEIVRNAETLELRRIQLRIQILSLEAKQGFEGGAWSPSVEKEAIRAFLVGTLRWLVSICEHTADDDSKISYVTSTRKQLELLTQTFRPHYSEIADLVRGIIDSIDKHENAPTLFLGWCRGAEDYFRRGEPPWV
jgi:hypothetical protein